MVYIPFQARSVSSSVWHGVFIRTYFRTVYFIITCLLSLFSILFGSSNIGTDIKKGIITNLLGYFFICLGSSIIIKYSLKLENQCFISYVKLHMKVQFIFFSIIHIFIIIYCYGFYFGLIGHFELHLFIIFCYNISRLRFENSFHLCHIINF